MTSATHFTDSSGTRWTVFEAPASRIVFDDRLVDDAPPHLTFETTIGPRTYLRRLRDYPPTWRDLAPAALEDLCHRAEAIGGVRGGTESDETRRSIDHLTT